MNVVYAASAYPAGAFSDRMDRRVLLVAGCGVLIAADLVLAPAAASAVGGRRGLWGLHMGLTQGLLATLVAGRCPDDMRGTAFGLYNL